MIICKCLKCLNERFFKGIFSKKSRTKIKTKDIAKEVFIFLRKKGIYNWGLFKKMNVLDKEIVETIIEKESDNEKQMKDVMFIIRYKLSNKRELMKYLVELENNEEYEKCEFIFKKIINKNELNKKF